jgi:hypothetical protein
MSAAGWIKMIYLIGLGLIVAGIQLGRYWMAYRLIQDPYYGLEVLMKYHPNFEIRINKDI